MPLVPIALALAQFAPHLMRYFGAGETSTSVAEQVVGIAQSITGAATPEAALEQMRASVQFQHQFAMKTLEIDAQLETAFLADRKDSRAHDIAVRQLNDGRNTRADVMIALDVVGLIACLVVLVFFRDEIPGEAVGLISTIASVFGLCLRDAHQFEFGSSRNNRDKDLTIARLAQQPQP